MVLLDVTQLDSVFSATITPKPGIPAKPSLHGIVKALDAIGQDRNPYTWYIGDDAADAGAAHAVSVQFAWASYGYRKEMPERTDFVLEKFEEVIHL